MRDLGCESPETLLQMLQDGDRDGRMAAMTELFRRAQEGDLRGVGALVEMLGREADTADPTAMAEAAADREYTVQCLEWIGTPVVDALLAVLVDRDRPSLMRQGAASALGNIGDPRARDALVAILQDDTENPDLRRTVSFYLGRIRDRRNVEPLLTIATDPHQDRTMRRNALIGLGELADPASFDALVSLLHDPETRDEAGTALQSLRDPRAITELLPRLVSDDEVQRVQIAAIVGKVGEAAVEPVLALLESADWRVRAGAAGALGFTKDRRAAGPLTEAALHDADSRVRREAAGSLGFLDGTPASETLVTVLVDEDVLVRLAAMQSLYHLALTDRAPTEILPRVEWVAEHDAGTIDGVPIIRDAGRRVVRELRRALAEKEASSGD